MSEEKQNFQRQADLSKPGGRHSVLIYLLILFAAAFILLLLSYLMQQRTNQAAMNNLQETSTSAVQSLHNLIAERDQLKEDAAVQQEQISALENQLSETNRQSAEIIQKLEDQRNAVLMLETLEYLCQENEFEQALEYSASMGHLNLESLLPAVDDTLSRAPGQPTLSERYLAVLDILEAV